jgi:drug/metabolite transporter (DMT)-like permease
MSPEERRTRLGGALIIAVAAIAFSGKGVIVKLAYRHGVDATTLLTLRMVFSAPFFLAISWWVARNGKLEALSRVDARNVVILGLIGYYLSSYFNFLGLQYISAALERLLLFLHPTFVVMLAAVVFKRRITGRDVIAIVLSYLGIALVFGHDLSTQGGDVAIGASWVLLSALLYSVYLVGSGRLVGRVGSLRFASYAGLVSCIAVIVHYLATRDVAVIVSQPLPVYAYGVLMAVACTVLPILLTAEGIRRMGSSHASIIGSVGPISTIFLGAIFLGDHVTAVQLAGAALVLAGVLFISLQKASG